MLQAAVASQPPPLFQALFLVFILLIFTTVISVFFSWYKRSKQRSPREQGRKPRLVLTCGAIVKNIHYSWPFIELRVYEDFLVVGCRRRVELEFRSIISLQLERFGVSRGIRIQHNDPAQVERVLLFAPGIRGILTQLRQLTGIRAGAEHD